MFLLPTIQPQNSSSRVINVHFVSKAYSSYSPSSVSTYLRCFRCSSIESEKIRMSSRQTTILRPRRGRNVLFIIDQNVVGALQSPNGIASYSYLPQIVLKAIFLTDPCPIRICQYPAVRSTFNRIRAFLIISRSSQIRGSGYLFFSIIELRAR